MAFYLTCSPINISPESGTMLLDLTDVTLIDREPGSLKGKMQGCETVLYVVLF